jgi:hypothetical protein
VTQVGEGPGAGYEPGFGPGYEHGYEPGYDPGPEPGYQAAPPATGELLAERYQLEQHINTDSAGRQIWRGMDILLRRPVAVVISHPGGPAAARMLQTAVEASRIVHPNLVGVYDAIDEHTRAYVVREWVDGASLREHVAAGLFDATRAVAVAHACAAAVNAFHANGITHGNVHPGTVLIGHDGRVVLADARADGAAPGEEDIRAVGGLLYYALTGYWPHAEVPGPTSLPDALRDGAGALATPRQVRAGVPDHLDNLTMDLLDRRLPVPPAEVLTGELGRLDVAPDAEPAYYPGGLATEPAGYYEPEPEPVSGPIRFSAEPDLPGGPPAGRKLIFGLAGLLAVGIVGLLVGINLLAGGDGGPGQNPADAGGTTAPSGEPGEPTGEPAAIPLDPSQVRVVDPPRGNRAELDQVEFVVDDDPETVWRTDHYLSADFGQIKPGMGILVNLGEPRQLATVRVELATPGATADLRVGDADPGSSSGGDDQIYQTYEPLGDAQQGETMEFTGFDPEQTYQYLMVWFSELAPDGEGQFHVEVQRITVEGY